MERRSLLHVLSGLAIVYLAARAQGQLFEDPTKTYKNMTFAYDVRLRGGLQVPRCVKLLMECWEVMKSDVICSHETYFETACSLMNTKRCHNEITFGDTTWPYNAFHMFVEICRDENHYT